MEEIKQAKETSEKGPMSIMIFLTYNLLRSMFLKFLSIFFLLVLFVVDF